MNRKPRTRWITAVLTATAAAYTALHGLVAHLFSNAASVLADYSRDQVNKAAELIEDDAIHQLRPGIYLAVSEDGSQVHRTATTGQCTCKAGLRTTTAGHGCYHVAAARALEVAQTDFAARPRTTTVQIGPRLDVHACGPRTTWDRWINGRLYRFYAGPESVLVVRLAELGWDREQVHNFTFPAA